MVLLVLVLLCGLLVVVVVVTSAVVGKLLMIPIHAWEASLIYQMVGTFVTMAFYQPSGRRGLHLRSFGNLPIMFKCVEQAGDAQRIHIYTHGF